jgi:hypothetical protein
MAHTQRRHFMTNQTTHTPVVSGRRHFPEQFSRTSTISHNEKEKKNIVILLDLDFTLFPGTTDGNIKFEKQHIQDLFNMVIPEEYREEYIANARRFYNWCMASSHVTLVIFTANNINNAKLYLDILGWDFEKLYNQGQIIASATHIDEHNNFLAEVGMQKIDDFLQNEKLRKDKFEHFKVSKWYPETEKARKQTKYFLIDDNQTYRNKSLVKHVPDRPDGIIEFINIDVPYNTYNHKILKNTLKDTTKNVQHKRQWTTDYTEKLGTELDKVWNQQIRTATLERIQKELGDEAVLAFTKAAGQYSELTIPLISSPGMFHPMLTGETRNKLDELYRKLGYLGDKIMKNKFTIRQGGKRKRRKTKRRKTRRRKKKRKSRKRKTKRRRKSRKRRR